MASAKLRRLGPAMRVLGVLLMLAGVIAAGKWGRKPAAWWTPLHAAARAGDAQGVADLLAHGLDVNRADPTGFTPLHGAAMSGDLDTIDLLLDAGADVDAADREG